MVQLDNPGAFATEAHALHVDCIEDEYLVLELHAAKHYGIKQAFPKRQRLLVQGERAFDILYLSLQDGTEREYWFDISSFYGQCDGGLSFEDGDPN